MRARNLVLPEEAAEALRALQDSAREGVKWDAALLDAYIAKLHYAGWTLESIARALGVTRERARQRCENATEAAYSSGLLPPVPQPPPPPRKPRKAGPPRMRPEFEQWLRETYAVARRCRGGHAEGSPERVASEKVWAAINSVLSQGVKASDLAKVLGVTRGMIRAGLASRGYRSLPPSQKAYQGKPAPGANARKTHCKNGHELAGENVRLVNGNRRHRICRACERARSKHYQQRKRRGAGSSATLLAEWRGTG